MTSVYEFLTYPATWWVMVPFLVIGLPLFAYITYRTERLPPAIKKSQVNRRRNLKVVGKKSKF